MSLIHKYQSRLRAAQGSHRTNFNVLNEHGEVCCSGDPQYFCDHCKPKVSTLATASGKLRTVVAQKPKPITKTAEEWAAYYGVTDEWRALLEREYAPPAPDLNAMIRAAEAPKGKTLGDVIVQNKVKADSALVAHAHRLNLIDAAYPTNHPVSTTPTSTRRAASSGDGAPPAIDMNAIIRGRTS